MREGSGRLALSAAFDGIRPQLDTRMQDQSKKSPEDIPRLLTDTPSRVDTTKFISPSPVAAYFSQHARQFVSTLSTQLLGKRMSSGSLCAKDNSVDLSMPEEIKDTGVLQVKSSVHHKQTTNDARSSQTFAKKRIGTASPSKGTEAAATKKRDESRQ